MICDNPQPDESLGTLAWIRGERIGVGVRLWTRGVLSLRCVAGDCRSAARSGNVIGL